MFPCQRRETLSDLWLCRSDRYSRPKNVIESLVRHRQWLEMARRGRICKNSLILGNLMEVWSNTQGSPGVNCVLSSDNSASKSTLSWCDLTRLHGPSVTCNYFNMASSGWELWLALQKVRGWANGLQAWDTKVFSMVSSWSLWAVAGFHLE